MTDKLLYTRELPDGHRVELWQYIFNQRLMLVADGLFTPEIVKQYCYQQPALARKAAEEWNGEGDPAGWFKNLQTQAYQREYGAGE